MARTLRSRWNRISLRTKITGVTVVMLTLGLLVSGIGTLTMLRSWALDQSDKKLMAIAQGDLSGYFKNWSGANTDASVFIALYNSSGSVARENWSVTDDIQDPVVPSSLTLAEATTQGGQVYTLDDSDGDQLFRAVTTVVTVNGSVDYQPVIIAISMADSEKLLSAYLAIYLGLGLGVIILGGLLTRMLVTTTFAPLRRVEQTAAQIAEGDLSQRMTGETPNTEVGRLNRSLNLMLNRIDRAFADRAHTIDQMRRFVGDASHELRTPLVSVRGYAELYRMGALQSPEDVAGAMERIEKEAIRMSGLVEDLLELARLDEAKPLSPTAVDLVPLARDAALDANAAAPDRVITLVAPLAVETISEPTALTRTPAPEAARSAHSALTGPIALAGAALARLRSRRRTDAHPASEPQTTAPVTPSDALGSASANSVSELREHPFAEHLAVVMAEENKLRQVLGNLVANAMRYTPDGSPIEIRVTVDEFAERAELAVIDHGEGVPPQIRDKIFQRFWRADTSRARETGGSGLGLAIAAAIIAAHHGTVDVVETPGGGAIFRVQLPLATSPAALKPSPQADKAPAAAPGA